MDRLGLGYTKKMDGQQQKMTTSTQDPTWFAQEPSSQCDANKPSILIYRVHREDVGMSENVVPSGKLT